MSEIYEKLMAGLYDQRDEAPTKLPGLEYIAATNTGIGVSSLVVSTMLAQLHEDANRLVIASQLEEIAGHIRGRDLKVVSSAIGKALATAFLASLTIVVSELEDIDHVTE